MRRRRASYAFTVAAAVCIAVTSAVSAAGAPLDAKLRRMVLSKAQVPHEFSLTARRSYSRGEIAAQGTWTMQQLRSWGYLRGREAEFVSAPETDAPAQLSSDAGAYRTRRGARRALAANGDRCQVDGWSELDKPAGLGSDARLCSRHGRVRGLDGEVLFVVFRIGRFKGAVTLSGTVGQYRPQDALVLARRQARKMRARF